MKMYFQHLPKEFYTLSGNTTALDIVTNITQSVRFDEGIKTNGVAYYSYIVPDGDTPESIADKIYGNSQYHWIVLLMNDIVHPQFDWPLDKNSFIRYVDTKYTAQANNTMSGLDWAKTNIQSYRKTINRTIKLTGQKSTEIITIDANSYANVVVTSNEYTLQNGVDIIQSVTKDYLTYYTYEENLNEEKRQIRLLKPQFLNSVTKEMEERFLT